MTSEISKDSSDITRRKIALLKQVIPECFSDGILDVDKLHEIIGKSLYSKDEKYFFNWFGRNDTFKSRIWKFHLRRILRQHEH